MSKLTKAVGRRAALLTGAVLGATAATVTPAAAAPAPATQHIVVHSCDEAHLQAAYAETQPNIPATITFACDGTINVSNLSDTVYVSDFRNVTFSGTGHHVTINGGNTSQLFVVDYQSTLGLEDLTLAGGQTQLSLGGGAVENSGTLTADHVTFSNNHAYNYGGAIASIGYASTTVRDSQFVDNQVTCTVQGNGGGAIAQAGEGPLTVTGTTFSGNVAQGAARGGAVYVRPSLLGGDAPSTISGSTFVNNQGTLSMGFLEDGLDGGGAVAIYGRAMSLDRDTFRDNAHNYFGGAVYFSRDLLSGYSAGPGGPLTITDSTFQGNTSPGVGIAAGVATVPGTAGALFVVGSSPVTVTRTTMVGNSAGFAGAVAAFAPLTMTDSLLANNAATVSPTQTDPQAGGVQATGATATLARTTLLGNAPQSCLATFGGSFVDGHGNVESPGNSCGFSTKTH